MVHDRTCALCATALAGAADDGTCPRCGIPQPGSAPARRLGEAEHRRRWINTVVLALLAVLAAVVFSLVNDPTERAGHEICPTEHVQACD